MTTPNMDQTVCYGSDEEENDSDITFSESTDEETDNNLNYPVQQAIQQGPSQQGPSQQGPSQEGPSQEGPSQQEPSQQGPSQQGPSQQGQSKQG